MRADSGLRDEPVIAELVRELRPHYSEHFDYGADRLIETSPSAEEAVRIVVLELRRLGWGPAT